MMARENTSEIRTYKMKEKLFITSYYKQLSADIKMYNYKINKGPKARANITDLIL